MPLPENSGTPAPILSDSAAEPAVLDDWNDTAASFPHESVHRLFAGQAARTPEAVAVVGEGGALSYGELAHRAAGIAGRLHRLGVRPGDRVGLIAERGLEMVAALLGILEAGGAYVPLDPAWPRERLALLAADAGLVALVGRGGPLAELPDDLPRLALDELGSAPSPDGAAHLPDVGPDGLAYVVYTSGSTGVPKGVEALHRGIVRLVRETGYAAFGPGEVYLQAAPLSFDAATFEIWGPLLSGGRLVLYPPRPLTLAELSAVVARERVTVLFLTTGLFHLAVEERLPGLAGLRQLLMGGEVMLPGHAARARAAWPTVELIHCYGPTENTTFSTTWRFPASLPEGTPPIGRPIANSTAHVLDGELEPVPAGTPGELYVGGAGLARGYLDRPALTAERFVPDPFDRRGGGRLYRTGDRAFRQPGGDFEFLGRTDLQVKIRGFRIEPGEIESALRDHAGVREAVVAALPGEGGDRRLVAWYVADGEGGPDAGELAAFLGRRLPAYMVPQAFVALPFLPLNANGKIDRAALPVPSWRDGAAAAPRTPLEERLAALWRDALALPEVGVDDDFFAHGGHSLSAIRLVGSIRRELGVEVGIAELFDAPTVAGLAALVGERLAELAPTAAAAAVAAPGMPALAPLPAAERVDLLPLSFAEERLWFLEQLAPGATYNEAASYELTGPVAPAALAAALTALAGRHEALRTRYVERGGEPRRQILPPAPVPLPRIDLAGLPAGRRPTELARVAAEIAALPFDLERGPVLRAALLRTSDFRHALLLSLHHIVYDGWSQGIVESELPALYEAAIVGRPAALAPLPVQYADYAAWQRAWPPAVLAGQRAYWRAALAGAPTVLELPTDRPRPPVASFRGASRERLLPAAAVAALQGLARQEGATLSMLLLAGFAALLSRYTGQEDLLIGTPVANRGLPELFGVVGFFVNTLALRARLAGDPGFRQLLRAAREAVLAAFAHQDLPFEALVEELAPKRDLARNPLVQAVLAVQTAGGMAPVIPSAPAARWRRLPLAAPGAKFDLALAVEEEGSGEAGGLRLTLDYAADLFTGATAARLLDHYAALLAGAAAAPDLALSLLPLLAPAERHQLTAEWNATAVARPRPLAHQRVAREAGRAPDALAVADAGSHLTHGELLGRAWRLAAALQRLGVGPEVRVGVCLERGAELAIAQLAVLAAGGAFVALDPALPEGRLGFALDDAAVPVLLSRSDRAAGLAAARGIPCLAPADPAAGGDAGFAPPALAAESLAYVVYTSGSTGRPKGVEIPHGAFANLIAWYTGALAITAADRSPWIAAVGFDASVLEIWPYLGAGASLHVVPEAVRAAPEALGAWMIEQGITSGFMPVPLAEALVAAPWPAAGPGRPSWRLLAAGGEAIRRHPPASAPFTLIDIYGPSECAVVSTLGVVPPGGSRHGLGERAPSLGRPIDNATVWVVAPGGGEPRLVPAGVAGELLIGGDSVGRGYVGRADWTAESFVPDPFGAVGRRLYRTGDRVRQLPDGQLEHLGRLDQQVKVRGQRIELGEIEAALLRSAAVGEAAVLAVGDRLVAFLTPRGPAALDAAALRAALGRELPDAMLPGAFVPLPALPRNASGKVDRRALAALDWQSGALVAAGGGAVLRTPVEELVAGLFEEVLGRSALGADDHFFHLGGHSLLVTRVLARLAGDLGVELPVRALFENPTVAALAREIEAVRAAGAAGVLPPLAPVPRDRPLPLSFAQERLWFLDRLAPGSPTYNVPVGLVLAGPLAPAALAAALTTVVARHEVLRSRFVDSAGMEGAPRLEIAPPAPVPLPVVDLAGLARGPREEELARLATEDAERPFDLAAGPLLRAALVRLGEAVHALVLTLHHIVYDGGSEPILRRELAALSAAASAGRPHRLPPLPLQYPDFAAWQRAWPAAVPAAQLAFWRAALAGAPTVLELPTDRPRPRVASSRGAVRELFLAAPEAQALRRLARQEGVTLYMLFLAGWAALLARTSGQDDLLVGTPADQRARPELFGLIGFIVNTLAMRSRLDGDPTFRSQLRAVRETALAAFAHQDLPFEALVAELVPDRELARSPLVQVLFAWQSHADAAGAGEAGEASAWVSRALARRTTAKLDLALAVEEREEGLALTLEYALDLFAPTTALRLLARYAALLAGAAAAPELPFSLLPLLSPAEHHQALLEWNDTAVPASLGGRVHERVLAAALARPGATAVADGGRSLSYGELAAQSARLAGRLQALGVGPEVRVGLALPRSPELVVAALAVLRAGGAFVALDPALPLERLAFQLEDSGAPVLLAGPGPLAELAQVRGIAWLSPAEGDGGEIASAFGPPTVAADQLAYVIYTSGSTGRPKGVEISHGGLENLIDWHLATLGVGPADRATLLAGVGFDASVWETWPYLVAGAALEILPDALRSAPEGLRDWLVERGITACWLPVPLAEAVLDLPWEGSRLRYLLTGSDRLHRHPPAALPFPLLNTYGPTEGTVICTLGAVPAAPLDGAAVGAPTLGRPLANFRLYVGEAGGAAAGPGVPGELLLGGAGLARGYLARPDLTAAVFVPDPFGDLPGGRLYRSGDLARFRADGEIEFLGRIDHQVKVRGFRIEPGEIEAVLARHEAVGEVAVVVAEGRLVAYFVPSAGASADGVELRRHLAGELPEYMVPASFVALPALPLNASGKVDRRALAARELPEGESEDGTPWTPLEEVVAGLWEEVLGRPPGRREDDFFASGGHSLLATRLLSRLRQALAVELPVRSLFENSTLGALAGAVEDARRQGPGSAAALPPLVRTARGPLLPLSFAERRLWFLDRLTPGPLYNVPTAFGLDGELAPTALAAALAGLIDRHEVLRSRYVEQEGEPWREIAPPRPVPLPLVDLAGLTEAAREAELQRLGHDEAGRAFDLARGPLVRATLVRLASARHDLLLTLHHIVVDGGSEAVLGRELAALYAAAVAGEASPLPPLAVQYADYAAWQHAWPPAVLAGQLAWWRAELAGAPDVLELPTDRPRPAAQSFRGASVELRLPPAEAAVLRQAARREGVTLYMLLLAGWAAHIARHAGQDDLLIGLPVAHRTRPELFGLVGFFVNTLPVRARLAGDPGFRRQLQAAREAVLAAFDHQDLPFEALVEELQTARDLARNPLVQVVLTLQSTPRPLAAGSLHLVPRPRPFPETAKFDLALAVEEEAGGGLALELEVATDLWSAATGERLLARYVTLLQGAAAAPELPLSLLPLLSPVEIHQATVEWNDTAASLPESSIDRLFAERAALHPDAVAVVGDAGALAYGELAWRAASIAHRLRRMGVRRGDRVGFATDRSLELVAALLGILEAGGAYVPLDPTYPRERLEYLIDDLAPAALLGSRRNLAALPGAAPRLAWDEFPLSVVSPLPAEDAQSRGALGAESEIFASASRLRRERRDDGAPAPGAGPEDLAYVLYTSGSTGAPKGVEVPHRAVVRLVRETGFMPFGDDEVFLQGVPLSFDVATLELWGPLLSGGRLVLLPALEPPRPLSPAELGEVVARHEVTTLWLTAGLFHLAVDEGLPGLGHLRRLFAGGDVLLPAALERARAVLPGVELINGYGPTENTTFSTTWQLDGAGLGASVPIGRPIANSRAYVLGAGLEAMPVGAVGELYVGGEGLARGYLGRPGLTAERFVPAPAMGEGVEEAGGRLYRTGDLARMRPDGVLEFLGRRDFQVKVRGFRVELGEIESALLDYPGVREAAVIAPVGEDGERRLVAFHSGDTGDDGAELRGFLKERLPGFMLPQVFVALPALPLSANGKVDRRALAELASAAGMAPAATPAVRMPRSPLEEIVAQVFAELLGLPLDGARVGADDDFFALGGHSLLATRLVSRLRQALGVELGLRDLFEAPTVAALAARAAAALGVGAEAATPPLVRVPHDRPLPLSFAQQRLWFLDRLTPESALYNIALAFDLDGPLEVAALAASLAEVVRRHAVLRSRIFEGDEGDGEPRQEILPLAPVALPVVDLERLAGAPRLAELARLADAEADRPFDLVGEMPLRASLLRLAAGEHRLLLTLHHIAADGWSSAILVGELSTLYAAAVAGRPSPLAELPFQYADYAAWQRAWPPEVLAGQLAWWHAELAGAPRVLELPTDRQRPAVQSFRGASRGLLLPAPQAALWRQAARQQGGTLYVLLLAGVTAILSRWTGQDDLLLGMPVAHRTRAEVEGVIGFFVNTLVARARFAGDPTFARQLAAAREVALAAHAHQDVPFEVLVEELKPERDLARNPLVQVVLTLGQGAPATAPDGAAPRFTPRAVATHKTAKFDLALAVDEQADGGLAFELEYATDLFHGTTAARLLTQLAALVSAAVAAPELPLSRLPLLSPAEHHQVVVEWNDTAAAIPQESVPALFAEQVALRPDAIALAWEDGQLSYSELARRAGGIARQLRRLGVGPEGRVGLVAHRSGEMVAAVLGILQAGGAYVPLDPAAPRERQARLLEDLQPAAVVGPRRSLADLPGTAPRLAFDAPPEIQGDDDFAAPAIAPERLAYVLYTSGSTGVPKGVEVSHAAVVRLVREAGYMRFGPGQVFLQLVPMAFDVSTFELWGPLLAGGRLALYPPGPFDLGELAAVVERHGVNVLWLTAGLFHLAAEAGFPGLAGLSILVAGGDVLLPAAVERVAAALPGVELINGYGPTENTTFSTIWSRRDGGDGRTVPIGRPIGNSRAYVVDGALSALPQGAVGELVVGGLGVARGYLGRPELTAERFVPNPFAGEAGGRLYRTGDLARQTYDGTLEFLGRRDTQVKVRGIRIELGEVESALLSHPGVREGAVAAVGAGAGDRRLVAYYVAAGSEAVTSTDLAAYLRHLLPDALVPQAFVELAALPYLASGKVDRRALPAPPWEEERADAAAEAPRTPLEARLLALWEEVLGATGLGLHDDFFAAGGHSLLAAQLVARICRDLGIEFPLRTLFQKPTVAELAAELAVGDLASVSVSPIRPVPRDGELSMSPAQLRQWFLVELEPGTTAYNVPLTVALEGPLHLPLLAASLAGIIERQESLRTTFTSEGGRPRPVIAEHLELPLPLIDLAGLPAEAGAAEARRQVQALGGHVFDLVHGPLVDLALFRLAADLHLLLVDVHHIVFDGWSWGVFLRELAALYEAGAAGRPAALPELTVQYADYAAWQQRWLDGEGGKRQAEHWRRQLAGAPGLLPLPVDRPRPAVQTYQGGEEGLVLAPAATAALRALGGGEGATLFMTLLAGLYAWLARATRQDDLNVGTFVANRRWPEIEPLVGFFLNTLVLRGDTSGAPTARGLLGRVRDTTLAAFEHQDFPFERLLDELGIERDPSRTPLFQVLLVLQNFAAPAFEASGLRLVPTDLFDVDRAHFDLTLMAGEEDGGLRIEAQYNRHLFDATTVRRFLGQLENLLAAMVAEPDRRLGELPWLAAAERQQALVEWADGGWPEAAAPALPRQLLTAQAGRTPDAVAVVAGPRALSYGELERRTGRLAAYLADLGLGPESLVGITVPRSLEMVIGVLAILETGAGYLPLDPDLPAERYSLLLEDSRAAALLAFGPPAAGAAGFAGPIVRLDTGSLPGALAYRALPLPAPGNLAYVIYTSGSTGRPKGVQCLHGALGQFIAAAIPTYGLAAGDRVLQFASLSFDVSLEEIFPCLAVGATLVLRDDAMLASPARFLATCHEQAITVLDLPTAYWHTVAAALLAEGLALPEPLRLVIMGGERPLPERVAAWLEAVGPRPRLWNTYGPTEATIMSTAGALGGPGAAVGATAVPLGRPWGGSRIWLLDARLLPVAPGVAGEMAIAGGLLARGYLGRPELTAAAFVPSPFGGFGERLYRSGDLARHRPDGLLEFLGRVDDQVKIRGFRVEPGEVAAVLARHPRVGQAVVVARQAAAGDFRLVAYFVASEAPAPTPAELREHLKGQLPAYLVPADLVALNALPTTATGKVDLAALPVPDAAGQNSYVAPQTSVEELLVEIWKEVLERDQVGVFDNLFDLGGHSLLIPRIVARIEEALEIELPMRALFEAPTVAELAVVIEDALLAQIEGLSDEEAAGLLGAGGEPEPAPE